MTTTISTHYPLAQQLMTAGTLEAVTLLVDMVEEYGVEALGFSPYEGSKYFWLIQWANTEVREFRIHRDLYDILEAQPKHNWYDSVSDALSGLEDGVKLWYLALLGKLK